MHKTVIAIAFLFVPLASQSASFDCSKSITNVEKLICQDTAASRTISELDSAMSDIYAAKLADAPDPDALKREQRHWLNNVRNKCLDVSCLETAYTRRIEQLTSQDAAVKQRMLALGKRDSRAIQKLSCNKEVESVLDEALRLAMQLPNSDSQPGPRSGDEVRSGYFYLFPDIATNYADAGCLDKANRILSLSKGAVSDQLKTDIAASMIKLGLPGKAEELVRTLDTPEKQSSLLVQLAALHIQVGDPTRADTLIKEVEENTHPKFQGSPTLELVRILIKNGSMAAAEKYAIADQSAYAKTSLIETAGGYLKERQTEKAEALFSKVLNYCGEAEGDCDYALFLTARAYYLAGRQEVAMKHAERIVSINTRTQTFVEIAKSTPDNALALKAIETARAKESQCTGDSCRYLAMSIAEGYGAASQPDRALNYLNKHFANDPIGRSIGLEKAVRQLAKQGKVKDAKRLMSEETKNSPSLDQMKQAIAVAELKNRELDSALSIVESISNMYVQFQVAITLAKQKPEFLFVQKWLRNTRPDDRYIGKKRPDDRYIETYAGAVQVLLAAAARDGHSTEARKYIETLDDPILKARGLIGIAQGLLQKHPGEDWAQSLGLTW
jgi:uncharacterized protein